MLADRETLPTQARRRFDPERAAAAHLLRRTSLSVPPERIDQLAGLRPQDAVAAVLERPPASRSGSGEGDAAGPGDAAGSAMGSAPVTDDWSDTVAWWLGRMADPVGGLTERMAWFWHGLLTTSVHKVSDSRLVADQIDRFRTDARSDYRTILHGYVASGALLEYLDASWSMAARPNENLARELMELFTIGRGNYGEDDVRAAARALAGWVVEDAEVEFRPENAFIAPLILLGEQASWDTTSVVDRLCDHPATAVRVAGRLWTDLVGTPPDPESAVALGAWWQERELAIDPLLERILADDAFDRGRMNRPRTGLEWYLAARTATRSGSAAGDGADTDELWRLEQLGQLPYAPPNVGGWPRDDRWLAPGSLLARGVAIHAIGADTLPPIGDTDDILDRCGLHEVTASTVAAIDEVGRAAAADGVDADNVRLVRWRLALSSPEFNLA